jgi:hypothetical protein
LLRDLQKATVDELGRNGIKDGVSGAKIYLVHVRVFGDTKTGVRKIVSVEYAGEGYDFVTALVESFAKSNGIGSSARLQAGPEKGEQSWEFYMSTRAVDGHLEPHINSLTPELYQEALKKGLELRQKREDAKKNPQAPEVPPLSATERSTADKVAAEKAAADKAAAEKAAADLLLQQQAAAVFAQQQAAAAAAAAAQQAAQQQAAAAAQAEAARAAAAQAAQASAQAAAQSAAAAQAQAAQVQSQLTG